MDEPVGSVSSSGSEGVEIDDFRWQRLERGGLSECMPRMNSVMERWVQTCRHELLDRTLIWNQRHLLHALHEYQTHYNSHRAHQAMQQAARYSVQCPYRSPTHSASPTSTSADATDSAASSTSTDTSPDLPGRHYRQAQPATSTTMPIAGGWGHGPLEYESREESRSQGDLGAPSRTFDGGQRL